MLFSLISQIHLLLFVLFVMSVQTELCNRLYLGGLDEKFVTYVQLGGVYKLTDLRWYDFPVLESEKSPGDYFYFNREVNHFFIAKDNQSSLGLGATVKGSVPFAPSPANDDLWISASGDEPYKDVIDQWFQYSYATKENRLISNGTYFKQSHIGLHCVPNELQMKPCSSRTFTINQPITWHNKKYGSSMEVNIPGVHSYELVPNVYRSLRPVYKRIGSGGEAYLYHDDHLFGTWNIGPDYNERGAYVFVRDTALSPEYITGQWFIKHEGEQASALPPIFGFECSGIESDDGCKEGMCLNGGSCLSDPDHSEIFCRCTSAFTGRNCETELVQCPKIEGSIFPSNTLSVLFEGLHEGALASFTCAQGFTPAFFQSRCVKTSPSGGTWQHYGTCSPPNTERPTTRATTPSSSWRRDYNSDNDEPWEDPVWLMPVVLVLVIFVTFMGPMFIAMFCKGFDGFFRMSSLVYWIMIWIYIPFLIICAVTDCTEVSDTLSILQTLTSIFTPILCVWILIESYFCSERKYITNLGKTDTVGKTIQKYRHTQPGVVWVVTCYHYETRTRTVYYTDANGNQQSRIETYQEMVITHTEAEAFDYNYWLDDSESAVEDVEKYRITRIKLEKIVQPGDDETQRIFNRQKQDLRARNENRDTFMSLEENQIIPGFENRLAAYIDDSANSWWVGQTQFWIVTLLGMTWPYRWYFKYKSGKTNYTVSKKIYLNRPEVNVGRDVMTYDKDAAQLTSAENANSENDNESARAIQQRADRLTTIQV